MCTTEKDIDTIFRISCYQSNCIHQAVKRSVAPKLITYLIGLASRDTLCAKDDRGNTPLHLAVDYERCIDTQLEVVKAFIARCDEAMDMRTNAPNSFSAYQWHEYSSELVKKARAAEAEAKTKQQKESQSIKENPKDMEGKMRAAAPFKSNPKTIGAPKGAVPMVGAAPSAEPDRSKEFSVRRSNTGSQALTQQAAALAVPSGAAGPSSNDGKSTSGKRRSRTKAREDAKVTEESANSIKSFLK